MQFLYFITSLQKNLICHFEGSDTGGNPDLPEVPEVGETNEKKGVYVVQEGDTLWKIIQEEFGLTDPNEIANQIISIIPINGGRLDKDSMSVIDGKIFTQADGIPGDIIYPGMEIVIDRSAIRPVFPPKINIPEDSDEGVSDSKEKIRINSLLFESLEELEKKLESSSPQLAGKICSLLGDSIIGEISQAQIEEIIFDPSITQLISEGMITNSNIVALQVLGKLGSIITSDVLPNVGYDPEDVGGGDVDSDPTTSPGTDTEPYNG